jgi:hypothetical protein
MAKGTPERAVIEKNWKEPYGNRITAAVFIAQNMIRVTIEPACVK